MLLPLKPLDFELAARPFVDVVVPPPYRAARLLIRWHGVPVGSLTLPVTNGRIRLPELSAALSRQLPKTLGPELATRALQSGRGGEPLGFARAGPPPEPRSLPRVSLVICTRDRTEDLARCLAAVQRLTPAPAEVIVVDNAPRTPATRELLQTVYPNYRYIREDQPGLDQARNRGVRESLHPIVAFTDDDVVVDPGWIGALAAAFAADPSVGLVTGLIEPWELETEAQVWFEAYGGFGRGYQRHYLQAWPGGRLPWTAIGAGQLGAGANMAMRRQIFEDVGGFDPALDVGTPTRGGGDHEMFHRLIKSGWVCLYEPAALVRHRHRRTIEELARLLYDYGHATRCFFERVALNFPEDRPGLRQLQRWWWREWAFQRGKQAFLRPTWFPPSFVLAEVRGFHAGRGAYARARSALLPDERHRPDRFRVPEHDHSRLLPGTRYVTVDVAEPLRDLPEGRETTTLEVVVRRAGQSLGSVRFASMGLPVSARRLADEIARQLWGRLLRPGDSNDAAAWADVAGQISAAFPAVIAAPATLPVEVPVTIIVATCDRPDPLRRCLRSLERLRTDRPVQRVVVDNRPSTGAAAAVVRDFPGVELVLEPRPGSAYARNAGIAVAHGAIIAMTDDDMEVAPDWLERLLEPFARADVLAVTGNTLPARVSTEAEKQFETYGGFARGWVERVYDTAWFQRFRQRAVPTWQIGGSGNAAFRTAAFADPAIGAFDERLGSGVPTGVGEDTKLFYDILHAGYTIIYQPAAIAWHHHRVTMRELRRQLYGYSKGHVAYHLTTWFQHRDPRALVRVAVELPLTLAQRTARRLLRRSRYPWQLLLTEMLGTLAGPWSLWAAHRHTRHWGRGARLAPPAHLPAAPRQPIRRTAAPAGVSRARSSAEVLP
jgi:O-antigen biosynthesis protein